MACILFNKVAFRSGPARKLIIFSHYDGGQAPFDWKCIKYTVVNLIELAHQQYYGNNHLPIQYQKFGIENLLATQIYTRSEQAMPFCRPKFSICRNSSNMAQFLFCLFNLTHISFTGNSNLIMFKHYHS